MLHNWNLNWSNFIILQNFCKRFDENNAHYNFSWSYDVKVFSKLREDFGKQDFCENKVQQNYLLSRYCNSRNFPISIQCFILKIEILWRSEVILWWDKSILRYQFKEFKDFFNLNVWKLVVSDFQVLLILIFDSNHCLRINGKRLKHQVNLLKNKCKWRMVRFKIWIR